MAKSFTSISKGIGLFDTLQFGKYRGCRADSIVEQDSGYIEYTRTNFGTMWTKEVYDAVLVHKTKEAIRNTRQSNALSKHGIKALFEDYRDNDLYDQIYFDDVPF